MEGDLEGQSLELPLDYFECEFSGIANKTGKMLSYIIAQSHRKTHFHQNKMGKKDKKK